MNKRFLLATFILVLGVFALRSYIEPKTSGDPTPEALSQAQAESLNNVASTSQLPDSMSADQSLANTQQTTGSDAAAVIGLNYGNFEGFVLNCFQGQKCKFADDPLRMYREFKSANNDRALDSLVSFMRSQLKDPAFRERYQDILLDIIHDFYPPEEIQFQEAAYYDYLGDKQKSLDIYLNLQEKAKQDPSLKNAPSLNIANTLYDLKRYKEALAYYQTALNEAFSGVSANDNDTIAFIEERIRSISSMTNK